MSKTEQKKQTIARIKRVDDDQRIVHAEVYTPYTLDTYGEFMTPEDIEVMAHRFMRLDLTGVIDTNHDNEPNGSYPIESYIVRSDNDPDFTKGSWVMAVKVPDDGIWNRIKSGELNGFSFEAMVTMVDYEVRVRTVRDHVGKTFAASTPEADHDHLYFVQLDEKGLVKKGWTSPGPDGHVHRIARATFTSPAGGDNHTHRFDLK